VKSLATLIAASALAFAPLGAHAADPHAGHAGMHAAAPAAQTHNGQGVVKKVDLKGGQVTLAHDPIASLEWPAMTMAFPVADAALLKGLKSGDKVNFQITMIDDQGVITAIKRK
jgi:Cu(I)/Ag(I) efflux system periplasmic protein CusF